MINDVIAAVERLKLPISVEQDNDGDVALNGGVFLYKEDDDYVCEHVVCHPSTREEPEDVDVCEFFRSRNKYDAIHQCVKKCMDDMLVCYFSGMSMAESMTEDYSI